MKKRNSKLEAENMDWELKLGLQIENWKKKTMKIKRIYIFLKNWKKLMKIKRKYDIKKDWKQATMTQHPPMH